MRKYKELLTLFKHPFTLIRLGRQMDGGYIVPKELISDNFLSCGISNEISFEQDYVKYIKNPNIQCYDGTISSFPDKNAVFNWHKINIGKTDTNTEISLNTIFSKYFNTHTVFCKMDIEGAEYDAFDSITDDNLNSIDCLVLEVHWLDTDYNKFEKLMSKLNNALVLIHKHDNNNGKYFVDDNEIIPRVYELTFVNKKYIKTKEINNVKLPINNLDFVNDKYSEVKIPTC